MLAVDSRFERKITERGHIRSVQMIKGSGWVSGCALFGLGVVGQLRVSLADEQ